MDVKEAIKAAAPRYASRKMPKDNAERVVKGALHLSPHLGRRMVAGKIEDRSVFIRELLPQDLKIEIERLTVEDAMKAASFMAGVDRKGPRASNGRNPPARTGSRNWEGTAQVPLEIRELIREMTNTPLPSEPCAIGAHPCPTIGACAYYSSSCKTQPKIV